MASARVYLRTLNSQAPHSQNRRGKRYLVVMHTPTIAVFLQFIAPILVVRALFQLCRALIALGAKPHSARGYDRDVPPEPSPEPPEQAAPGRPVAPGRIRRLRRIRVEILLVLGLSLGASAVYSIVAILNRLTRETPLSSQTATLNDSLSDRPVFDLVYQLLAVFFDLVPVALAAFLLWRVTRPHLGRLGIDGSRPWRDVLAGLGLAVVIGVPGLALYLAGHAIGITVHVQPNALDTYWWTIPVLLLSALRAGSCRGGARRRIPVRAPAGTSAGEGGRSS